VLPYELCWKSIGEAALGIEACQYIADFLKWDIYEEIVLIENCQIQLSFLLLIHLIFLGKLITK
jgi:hypothetical protein